MTNSIQKSLSYLAVIPAGGIGSRFSQMAQNNQQNPSDIKPLPKQLRQIMGKTILEHSVANFIADDGCQSIVIVAVDSHFEQIKQLFRFEQKVQVVHGGKTRAESVFFGLKHLNEQFSSANWVMVHDAARPNLRLQDIEKLKKAVLKEVKQPSEVPFGAILATASQETIKQARIIEHNVVIDKTLNREIVWQAKTPQLFQLGHLELALQQVLELPEELGNITDEASAMERFGAKVFLVEGRNDNVKMTQQSDWQLLEFALKQK